MALSFGQVASAVRQILDRTSNEVNEADRRTLIAVAISRAISLTLTLPSSEVENLQGYYANTHEPQVEDLLSKINSQFVIDVRACLGLCYDFYKFRYDLVYDSMVMTKLFPVLAKHADIYFSQNVLNIMSKELDNKDDEMIGWYYNSWINLVRAIVTAIHEEKDLQSKPVTGFAL